MTIRRSPLPVRFLFTLALVACAPGFGALAAERLPVQADQGPMLRIPGLPPVPMPPNSRIYGPDGQRSVPTPPRQRYYGGPIDRSRPDRDAADQADAEKKKNEAQQKAAAPPKTREEVLNDLFGRLAKAQDQNEARGITRGIERLWRISGSDTVDLLLTRAQEAARKRNFKLALNFYDKIVVLEPDWAEGWNQRATTRFYLDDDAGAIEDIAHTLALEPRHFGALTGLGFILKRGENKARALQAFRKSLEINPQQDRVRKQVEELTLEVDGRPI